MVTPVARREAVAHLCQSYEASQRRACQVLGTDRTSIRYRSRKPDDGVVRGRLRELATARRRFGYRRLAPPAPPRGRAHEPQEAAAALCRGTAPGPAPRRAQAGARHPGADDAAAGTEPALVPGLRQRHVHRQPALPYPGRGRRLHAGMFVPGGRHLALRHPVAARAAGLSATTLPLVLVPVGGLAADERFVNLDNAHQLLEIPCPATRRERDGTCTKPSGTSRTPSSDRLEAR